MNKSTSVLLAALLAGGASLAAAQASAAIAPTEAQRFADQFRTLQDESTSMPAGSPTVDRHAQAVDPVPAVTTVAQEKAWFPVEEQRFDRESMAMPSEHLNVNRNAPAADALPKATTPAQKAAANAAEWNFLRQNSSG